jgi:DNA polymerase III alpha subunit
MWPRRGSTCPTRCCATIAIAQQMIGMPRHLGQHVGGFILTERPLTETVPIGNGAMPDRSFIEWDKDDIDALGILKVDILALGMLTCIRKCFDLISAHYGQTYDAGHRARRRIRASMTCSARATRSASFRWKAGRR